MPGVGRAVVAASLLLLTQGQVAVATASEATSCPSATGTTELTVSDVPEGTSATDCGLVGQVVRLDGVGVVIPRPGVGVALSAVTVDGSAPELTVEVSESGVISYGSEQAGDASTTEEDSTEALTAALGQCEDISYDTKSYAEWGTYNWYVGDGGMPGALTKSEAATAFTDAINNITGSYNTCGLDDEVGASASYKGTHTYESDVDSNGNCTDYDDVSTWDAGNLDTGSLAITCVWYWPVTLDLFEADVRYNTNDYNFTDNVTSSCSDKYDLRGVGTHEAGHVFGLDHVEGADHSNLTMYPKLGECTEKWRTLGYGDVRGLRSLY
ncbi:matrixin family metalloprotease [Streptomyces europaeiscabiei]|uniref:matrixin family metalloprotease n=1 Tax=Streptomyces europaeiscabiei TaxID=146819 RepID=UPI000B070F88|nr:matrixin family metalloprotease [Streptomyces europaeiscabiei]